jgi:hypothetical protein
MKDSDDIANLLKQFGGRPDEYYEIGRASEARDSQARWPLLSSIEATQGEHHPPVEPHMPGAETAAGIASLRARIAPPVAEARVEPRFAPAPVPAAPPAPVAAVQPLPAARSAPQAQFVPPRPRGHIVPPTRPNASQVGNFPGMRAPEAPAELPEPFTSPVAAAPQVQPAPQAGFTLPQVTQPPVSSAATAGSTPLQSIFSRLSQPKPAPEPSTTRDKNASLLQRLRRL